jgi:hypothetical protein
MIQTHRSHLGRRAVRIAAFEEAHRGKCVAPGCTEVYRSEQPSLIGSESICIGNAIVGDMRGKVG